MPYIVSNGQLYSVTQAEYDSYTAGSPAPAGAVLTTPGAVAAGGTQLVNNSATTPILTTTNTTNNSPGQTLTTTSAAVVSADTQRLIDSGLYDPGVGFNTNGTPKTTASTTVDTPAVLSTTYNNDGSVTQVLSDGTTETTSTTVSTSTSTTVQPGPGTGVVGYDDNGTLLPGYQLNETGDPVYVGNTDAATIFYPDGTTGSAQDSAAALNTIQGKVQNAQSQQTLTDQRKQVNNGDWRVRLRLAPQSTYLYNAPQPGILQPLKVTDGVIFPYTPTINTNYRAQYSTYDLTHSNYRGYFYQNSYVDAISITATFTAQDTSEANYLLAVIHFFRSATKMFYGQDSQRGTPPPLVYLSGLGDYQFKEHAAVIQQFTYNLPADVDYIRAGSPNNVGLNLTSIRARQDVATNSVFGQLNRLAAAFLTKGAITNAPAPPTLGLNRPTYVPTKMEISLTLLPVQSRQQVSKQFSLKEFANGNLLKGGFW
jgi:hypothetical protein